MRAARADDVGGVRSQMSSGYLDARWPFTGPGGYLGPGGLVST